MWHQCISALGKRKMCFFFFAFMSDTVLSTLVSKQTLAESEDHFDQKTDGGGADSKETPEQKTAKQEDSCSMKDIFEDDEETDDSSTETNSNSWLHEYEPSPLTSSPCSEEAGEAGGDDEHLLYCTGFFE